MLWNLTHDVKIMLMRLLWSRHTVLRVAYCPLTDSPVMPGYAWIFIYTGKWISSGRLPFIYVQKHIHFSPKFDGNISLIRKSIQDRNKIVTFLIRIWFLTLLISATPKTMVSKLLSEIFDYFYMLPFPHGSWFALTIAETLYWTLISVFSINFKCHTFPHSYLRVLRKHINGYRRIIIRISDCENQGLSK